jgi:phosphatidylserine/phosphatidylglycerophosphate/cardiolipin synthase-like enzyme
LKLIVQPGAGLAPVLSAIKAARTSIDILIFRLDRSAIAKALVSAAKRGVNVRALTAHTNRGGVKHLRKLELQLFAGGVTVSRTADDLVRYHGKMMVVDRQLLHVYGFNFTALDTSGSRSFGIITENRLLVREALRLFDADFNRKQYRSGTPRFIVSPENSRQRLSRFLHGARRQLLIYDAQVSDDQLVDVLTKRVKAGVDVKIMGRVEGGSKLKGQRYPGKRLHVRAIIRDGREAFIGSQSMRTLELDRRREVGIIINDRTVVQQMKAVFERDWAKTDAGMKDR